MLTLELQDQGLDLKRQRGLPDRDAAGQSRSKRSVGSDDKVAVVKGLGVDVAINCKATADLAAAMREACPGGADLYFDNVAGKTLDVMLPSMHDFGRIVVCGMIANYNNAVDPYPIRNLWQVLVHRITMKGFLTYEQADMLSEAEQVLTRWIATGAMKPLENVTTGLANHCLVQGSAPHRRRCPADDPPSPANRIGWRVPP